ncbi:adenylate/guanylate cyclase domain-containing protein, partial [Methylobacterium sp. WL103]
ARVERLCKTYDTPLIATDTFIDGLAHALEPLGIVALRGFAERHALFGHRRTAPVEAPAA